ncbi:hypothetical protein ACFYNO_21185 [Kitasatospora sp. NPDC006697]|uniref:hypothetical protein n=1 Tax=Kitasatospora sp. NPDC006697 TaxID=3364020 RepID=UPI00368430C3
MAVIALTGGPGAPGTTTSALALLLAWPLAGGRRVLLVECDPDGGAALAGALQGRVDGSHGLRNLAVADRRGILAEALWEQLIDLSPGGTGDRLLLPGLTDPAQAAGLAYTWEPLIETLRGLHDLGYDVLLDLGRSGALGAGAVLARRADCVAATVRTTLRGLSTARPRVAALREDLAAAGTGADGLGLLLITEGPYPPGDVTRELGLPLLGTLPYASRTARVLSDGGDSTDRRFIRSELLRAARTVADRVLTVARQRHDRLTPVQVAEPVPEPEPLLSPSQPPYQAQEYYAEQRYEEYAAPAAPSHDMWGGPVPGTMGDSQPWEPVPMPMPEPEPAPASWFEPPQRAQDTWGGPVPGTYSTPPAEQAWPAGWERDADPAPAPAQQWEEWPDTEAPPSHRRPAWAQPNPAPGAPPTADYGNDVVPGVVPPSVTGQAFASPAGQVFVPQAGPVQVRPGTGGYPPLAGIAPHPAAPEPFPAPPEDTEPQGEVLRAR